MLGISLFFLVVYVFGAFAYGSAALLWLRQASPVWHPRDTATPGETGPKRDRVSLALFLVSTVWFVLHSVIEFRELAGVRQDGLVELAAVVLVFAFPPLIMHTVLNETHWECHEPPAPGWLLPLGAMYVVSPLTCVAIVGAMFGALPRPQPFAMWIGTAIGVLFLLASIYSTALMSRRTRRGRNGIGGGQLRRAMIILFAVMSSMFFVPYITREPLVMSMFDHVVRTAPLFFLVVSVYFENRFEFYDLVVKRATLLLASILLLGAGLAAGLPLLEQLPGGMARPWLFAIALVPIAIAMPWLHAWLGRELDRLWFGREFTPVDAVKHVLAAMQPADDEGSLVGATSERLSEIFGTPIVVLLEGYITPDVEIRNDVVATTPSGQRVRFAVLKEGGGRPLLSEDLTLLHSLAGVFGFMLENVRLQRKRNEQEQVAQELRLQSSRSELKALRAQINPHFFFNALNAIASLIHSDPARADTAVEQLAEVFRYTLRRSDSEWAPLDQELAFARAYLDVEQARFGTRLMVTIEAEPPVLRAQVPSMLLQTLVENAVKHGISQVRGPGHIRILAAAAPGDRLVLEVRDTGPGVDANVPRRTDGESFGLRSVRDRLAGHFGGLAALSLERDEASQETVARIVMPLVAGEERARARVHTP